MSAPASAAVTVAAAVVGTEAAITGGVLASASRSRKRTKGKAAAGNDGLRAMGDGLWAMGWLNRAACWSAAGVVGGSVCWPLLARVFYRLFALRWNPPCGLSRPRPRNLPTNTDKQEVRQRLRAYRELPITSGPKEREQASSGEDGRPRASDRRTDALGLEGECRKVKAGTPGKGRLDCFRSHRIPSRPTTDAHPGPPPKPPALAPPHPRALTLVLCADYSPGPPGSRACSSVLNAILPLRFINLLHPHPAQTHCFQPKLNSDPRRSTNPHPSHC